jgi:hypothetical protein
MAICVRRTRCELGKTHPGDSLFLSICGKPPARPDLVSNYPSNKPQVLQRQMKMLPNFLFFEKQSPANMHFIEMAALFRCS